MNIIYLMKEGEFNCRADVVNNIIPMLHLNPIILTTKSETRASLFKIIYDYCIKPNSENANESIDPELKEIIKTVILSYRITELAKGKILKD